MLNPFPGSLTLHNRVSVSMCSQWVQWVSRTKQLVSLDGLQSGCKCEDNHISHSLILLQLSAYNIALACTCRTENEVLWFAWSMTCHIISHVCYIFPAERLSIDQYMYIVGDMKQCFAWGCWSNLNLNFLSD